MNGRSLFARFVLFQLIGIVILLTISLIVIHALRMRTESKLKYELAGQAKNIIDIYISSLEKSLENIINSYAEWTKLYRKTVKNDVRWLKETMGTDIQINSQFASYGIIGKNGQIIFGKDVILTKSERKKLLQKIKKHFKISSKIKHPLVFFCTKNGKYFLVAAAPLSSDTGVVLSYITMFFAKDISHISSTIHRFNHFLSGRCSSTKVTALYVKPLLNIDEQPIGYIAVEASNAFYTFVSRLSGITYYFIAGVLAYFLFTVAGLYIFRKTVFNAYQGMLECLTQIGITGSTTCRHIDRLSKRSDELGEIARKLKEITERIKDSIVRDPLTRLFNRRYCRESLSMALEWAKRYDKPLSIGMIDIDNFKRVNDTYGHLVGDQVLICLAHRLKRVLRRSDYLCRVGGEEFVFVMPETDLDTAFKVAERLRNAIETYVCETTSGGVKITISIGIATSTKDDTYETLIVRADRALYMAKRMGKNRVCTIRE